MAKTGEEIIIEGLLAQFKDLLKAHGASKSAKKPLGDEALRIEMRQLTKNIRSMQSQTMADAQHRRVRENIERRAELRDKTSVRMPNIARLLTGGAESPVAGFGRMQKAATKPFKAIYDYKKAQDESAAFKEEMRQEKSADPNFTMSKKQIEKAERLEDTESGAKKRAGSGMGKNLMGKRMQGMIGKVGKFMESSKGQGMMAGGMMGASILTMIIKKAMEASPMLQQMLKIMNVAMTLFLRPIGDFIGGMLKPIMLFFLREVAVPMLAKGKGMIKMGETFGKQVLGFLLKPVETIQHAIQAAIHWDAGVREISAKFDGIKEWMTEQRMNVIAADMGYDTRHELQKAINEGLVEGNVDRAHKFGGSYTQVDNSNALIEEFKGLREDLQTKEYNYATDYSYGGAGGGVGVGMGAIAGQFTLVSEASGKVVTALELLAETLNPTQEPVPGDGPVPGGTTTDTGGTLGGEFQGPALPHWSDINVYDTVGKMFAAASQQIMQTMQKNKKGSPEYEAALKEYTELTGGPGGPGSQTVLEGIRKRFEAMQDELEKLERISAKEEEIRNSFQWTMVKEMENITTLEMFQRSGMNQDVVTMAEDTAKSQAEVRKLLNSIRNMNVGGSGGGSGGGGGSTSRTLGPYSSIYTGGGIPSNVQSIFNRVRGNQHGGMINEPIWGIGASGQSYMFGEAGPERVIPTGASTRSGGGVGPVTINVNVDSINSDVDLEKIKPVVERALQEVHARRGII